MGRPRSFWEARVAELAHGHSVERVAQLHGVRPGRLRWWRWRLGTAPPAALAPPRLVEIVAVRPPAAPATLRILVGDVVLELPTGTPPEYVGRVLGAARAAC